MKDYIIEAFCSAVRSGMFVQNEEGCDERLSYFCCELNKNYSKKKAIQKLFKLALSLNMTPYLKRTGGNVANPNYHGGDVIGIYFSNDVRVNEGNNLVVAPGSKFFGLDVAGKRVNFQFHSIALPSGIEPSSFLTDLIDFANEHKVEYVINRGSLRVSASCESLSDIVDWVVGKFNPPV